MRAVPQVQVNQLSLEYDSRGNRRDPAVLLIMGLGSQLVLWPDALCDALARAGYYVIRFDNRDVGLSSKLEHAGTPNLLLTAARARLGLAQQVPYRLDDMARDAVGLLAALDIEKAHIVGASMGGMIAQIIAAKYAHRALSLTSIMSTSGAAHLPGPSLALKLRMLRRRPQTRAAAIRFGVDFWRQVGSPGFPQSEAVLRQRVAGQFDRGVCSSGLARQLAAILADGSRSKLLRKVRLPTLVLHGAADPLIPAQAAWDLASSIRGAQCEVIAGMGHDLPPQLLPYFAQRLSAHFAGGGDVELSAPAAVVRRPAASGRPSDQGILAQR